MVPGSSGNPSDRVSESLRYGQQPLAHAACAGSKPAQHNTILPSRNAFFPYKPTHPRDKNVHSGVRIKASRLFWLLPGGSRWRHMAFLDPLQLGSEGLGKVPFKGSFGAVELRVARVVLVTLDAGLCKC